MLKTEKVANEAMAGPLAERDLEARIVAVVGDWAADDSTCDLG